MSKIEEFENLLLSTKREGVEALLEFVRKSDFYTAPASTRFHSCHERGLLEHSLNVYKCLKEKENNTMWTEVYNAVGKAMAKHKLVLALPEADQEATYLLEEEC